MRGDRLLLQYRVDLNIDEDRTFARKSIVKRIKDKIPTYLFDGTIMHTMERIFPEADGKSKEFDSQTDDGQFCKVVLKMVGEVQPTDHHYLQVYNIIMRRMMETLDLQELRRNYYDPNASIMIDQYNLEVWPGYITSIRQHEHAVLMVTEIDHKILRTDTAMRQMQLVMSKTNSQDAVKKALIGCIVMTRYNKKTYRVDDIDFTQRVTCKKIFLYFFLKMSKHNTCPFFQRPSSRRMGQRKPSWTTIRRGTTYGSQIRISHCWFPCPKTVTGVAAAPILY